MNVGEQSYLNLLSKLYRKSLDSEVRKDRTGVGTTSLFGESIRFDLREGFPLLTTKRLHIKSIVHELLWMLYGNTNIQYLKDNGVTIWNEWADENGDLGPVYGAKWRNWDGHDQIKSLVDNLNNNPFSRRHVVSCWDPNSLEQVALVWCHCLFQCYVREENGNRYLDLNLYQRSADVFLGVPYNIASYALLMHMLAKCTNLTAGVLTIMFGDVHLYSNHVEAAATQLSRRPFYFPSLKDLPPISYPWQLEYHDIEFVNYASHDKIQAPVAV